MIAVLTSQQALLWWHVVHLHSLMKVPRAVRTPPLIAVYLSPFSR